MGISISGTEIILSDLEKLVPTDMDIDDALTAGAQPILNAMVRLAPRGETKRLVDSIKVGNVRTSRVGKTITIGIHRRDFGKGEYYPAYVEYGHGGPRPAQPHPFIRPAYDMARDEGYNTLKQTVIKQLNEKGI